MKRTKDDADITRAQLLDAALRVFSREGYAAAKLDDIAKAAGVTRGAIAHHFGGKPDLFTALMAECSVIVGETVLKAHGEGGTPRQRLKRLMLSLLHRLEDDERYRAVRELMLFQLGSVPPELRQHRTDEHKRTTYDDGLGRLVTAGIEAGEFRADLDRAAATKGILGLLTGLSVNWMIADGAYPLRAIAEPIVDTHLAGLENRAARRRP